MTILDENTQRFFRILRNEDPVHNYLANQGWDELSNIDEWTETLTEEERASLILSIEDLLVSENLAEELVNEKHKWRQEEVTLLGLDSIYGFNDWLFLWKLLNDPRHCQKFHLLQYLPRFIARHIPPEMREDMSHEMKKKYIIYFEIHAENRNELYLACAEEFAQAYGTLAGAEAFKDMLLFLGNDLIFSRSYGSFGSMLLGAVERRLDYDKIREYVTAAKAKMSQAQRELFYKMLDPNDLGLKIGSRLIEAMGEPELARQIKVLYVKYGMEDR